MAAITQTTIRRAVRSGSETLCQMIQAMAKESEDRVLDPSTLQAGVQAVFDNPALGTYWAIEQAGQLIGCTLITVEWSDWNNAPYWWIQSLYIQPEFRGQGIFEQLLSTLETEAKNQNVSELRLYVEQQHQRAIRVYQRNGFDGNHYACMIKPLTTP